MTKITCKLLSHSIDRHIQQLYTGFLMLSQSGLINLTQEIKLPLKNSSNTVQHLQNATQAHLLVEISCNDKQKLMLNFDNHDSKEIETTRLKECDIYFKRSYSKEYIIKYHTEGKNKIYPLGLNYKLLPNSVDVLALQRNILLSTSIKKKIGGIISSVDSRNIVKFQPRLRNLHSLPIYSLTPQVLFMATAYDPYDNTNRIQTKIDERIHNNEVRANCIRILRKELGPKFYGGFMHNKFTMAKYRDILIDYPANATRKNYLQILKKFPIGIATTGLHGSIGGKLAEYVAFSKAIVSEKLQYEIPGEFLPEQNFLEFSSPENCVEQSMKLLTNDKLRNKLMSNNSQYYQQYVKPDMLVVNTLSIAIEKLNK